MLQPGDRAPDFELADQKGRGVRLSDFLNETRVVLFFYPRDDTRVCTKEACGFRDLKKEFLALGAAILGVSGDPVDSHRRFADGHKLNYPILSDAEGAVRTAYGVRKTLGILPGRVTFVIDREGAIRGVIQSALSAEKHVQGALAVLRELEK